VPLFRNVHSHGIVAGREDVAVALVDRSNEHRCRQLGSSPATSNVRFMTTQERHTWTLRNSALVEIDAVAIIPE
jgi:hypothetical protein